MFLCEEVACFFYVKRFLSQKKSFQVKTVFLVFFVCFFGHYCHNCHSCNYRFVERVHDLFWWRGSMIFFWEVVWFCVWRGCVIFMCWEVVWFFTLSHSCCLIFFPGGCLIFFAERLCDFFGVIFCVERFHDFFVERLHDFFCLTACVISFA